MRCARLLAALALFAPIASTASADSLFFKDGRFYEVPKLVKTDQGFEAQYPHGTVAIPAEIVKEYFISKGGDDFTAKNDDEAKKLAQGLVPFEGKWIAKAERDKKLEKRSKARADALEEFKKHQEWRERYKASTAHFNFEYTVPQDVGANYMALFETYFDTFAREWGVKQPPNRKLKVCFYNKEDDFHRIGNAPRGVLGYFRFVEPIELNFFYERDDERLTLDVLFHETNHYLFHLYTDPPFVFAPWIDEGMAEYYGSSEWDPVRKTMTSGQTQEGRLVNLIDAIDGGEMQDLKGLMSEPRIDAMQYAWAWSLNHMLMQSPKYKEKYRKYLAKLAKDPKLDRETWPGGSGEEKWMKPAAAIDLFQKMLEIKNLDAFEQEWYAYIKQMNVKTARGYTRAAQFCEQWGRWVRAALYYKKAIELYSRDPSTYSGYARALRADGKDAEAVKALEQAIELDPMNPALYLRLGKACRALDDEASKERGKKMQLLAIEMDPNDAGLVWDVDPDVLKEAG